MVEENHHFSSNLLSREKESSIKINSISIDLVGANEEIGLGKCEHFCIRGFVSEIRKRDRKKCWPFSLNANADEQNNTYPPLSVPKSRWWRCENCLREINAEVNESDMMLLSDLQLSPTSEKALGERKGDANTPVVRSKSVFHPSTCSEKKEKKAEVATTYLIAGNDISSDENENINQERCDTDDIAALLKKDRCRSISSHTVGNDNKKIMSLEDPIRKSRGIVNTLMEISQTENLEIMNNQNAEVVTAFCSSDIAGVVDDTPKAIKNHKSNNFSTELDECDDVSTESALLARDFRDHNPDKMNYLHHRKPRNKVRLLSELLAKADAKSTSMRSADFLSKRELVKGRKRKSPEDEEWRPPMITPQNNYVNRKLWTISQNAEGAPRSCDSEDNSISRLGLQPSVESQSTDNGFDRDLIKGKKKNKRFQVADEHLPAVSREDSQKDIQENTGDSDKGNGIFCSALFSSVHSAFTGGDLVPCPLHAQKSEKSPTSAKKKNKMPFIDSKKKPVISYSNGVLEENPIEMRRPEVFQCNSVNIPVQSTQDVSNGKELDLSLENFSASERYVRKHILQVDDRPVFSLPWQEVPLKIDHASAKDAKTDRFRYLGSSSKSEQDACLRTGPYIDLSGTNNGHRMPFLNEKKRYNPATEVGSHSIMHQVDASGSHGKGKTIVIQEHSGTSRNQSDHRAEKTTEHLDDIPMEIVELMAKNQYERCLPDGEDDNNNNKRPSQATNISKNALLIDLNKTYENGVSQEDNTSRKPKPRGKNTRKGENLPNTKLKSVEYFPVSQFGRPYFPSGFGIFPQSQENPSSSIQFSAIGSSVQSGTHNNCQWSGNMENTGNQNPPPSSFRVLRACNTCQSVPQNYKESSHHLWPSMMPQNLIPISHHMHQKYMDQSNKVDMPSRATNSDLNSWNLYFFTPGKQKRGFDSQYAFGCKHSGINRSLDPYSDESSIPAMHLLSLMDPRLRSNAPIDLAGNSKSLKRPSISQVNHSKEFAGLQVGDCNKSTNAIKQSPFDLYDKKLSPETSRETFLSIPTVGTSGFSFQNDKSFTKCNGFTAQASMTYQEKKGKKKDNISATHNSQKPIFASCDTGKSQFVGASDSTMFPLKFYTLENARKQKAKVQSYTASIWPPKSRSGSVICGVNRNPADFTVPELGNAYMIKGEDLKIRKRAAYGKKTGLSKSDGEKQRNKKLVASARENA